MNATVMLTSPSHRDGIELTTARILAFDVRRRPSYPTMTLVWVEGIAEPFEIEGDHRERLRHALNSLASVADDAETLRAKVDELNTTVSFLLESSAQTLNTSTEGFKSASGLVDIVCDLSKRVDGIERATGA